jgi:hypothetical protein
MNSAIALPLEEGACVNPAKVSARIVKKNGLYEGISALGKVSKAESGVDLKREFLREGLGNFHA